MKLKGIITGIISFGLVFLIPVSGKIIEGLLLSVPVTVGAKGIEPAIIKIGIALLLWLILFLIFGRKKKAA